jgi:deoxyribodipyrimidine photolyase-related protein
MVDIPSSCNRLFLVLGDQLDYERFLPDDFDAQSDLFWMAEASEESTHVRSNKHRIVCFLAAMRHFRNHLQKKKIPLLYHELSTDESTLSQLLAQDLAKLKPAMVSVVKPGDYRVEDALRKTVKESGAVWEVREDEHFLCSHAEFAEHAKGRKSLRMEFFYREMRRKYNILMDGKDPVGGAWNFDKDNRESFGKQGPPPSPMVRGCKSDEITKELIELVNRRFPDHPGDLRQFIWPVTPQQAEDALAQFIEECLPCFGRFQDAMWTDEYTLFHSLLGSPINLRLLDPRKVIEAAEQAYFKDLAPLPAVEGFIRQILGWREYVRGIYHLRMPEYREMNFLEADRSLPEFFWTGKTEMACMRSCLKQVLETGYGHHIQRLMVIGLYSLLHGVRPGEINDWFLANYVDAVDWVTTPNVVGMSQFADGGIMASKPYSATGAYIDRMSNYCKKCRFKPKESTGPDACPFTTLYWDFLDRHRDRLGGNQRLAMQMRNLARLSEEKLVEIRKGANFLRRPS